MTPSRPRRWRQRQAGQLRHRVACHQPFKPPPVVKDLPKYDDNSDAPEDEDEDDTLSSKKSWSMKEFAKLANSLKPQVEYCKQKLMPARKCQGHWPEKPTYSFRAEMNDFWQVTIQHWHPYHQY
eukprot:3388139-Pyramimonas_sp.AAC.1